MRPPALVGNAVWPVGTSRNASSLFRKQRQKKGSVVGEPTASRRICLILQSGIGDVVHGLPLVNALKRDDPRRHITWVVERVPSPLLRPHPAVDEVVLFDRRGGLKELRALRRQLRGRSFDVVLNCGIYFKSVVPTFLARAPYKVGYGRDRANDLAWLWVNHRVPARGQRHRQDMYLELIEPLGVAAEPLEWRLEPTEEERRWQTKFFDQMGDDHVVGIVTTSAIGAKDWPVERFAQLALALQNDFGLRVLLLGGPGAREQQRARAVMRDGQAVWGLGSDLRKSCALLDRCDLVVAPDTGPLHIARALRTPVIGLYGHTNPQFSGPYRAYEDLTIDRYNYDAPGVLYTGPVERLHPARAGARRDRMKLIQVAEVLQKVQLALDRYVEKREP